MNITLPKWFVFSLLGAAFVGFIDASYLTINNIMNGFTPCSLTEGCEVVTSSVYSTIWGVPISAIGVVFYLSALILVLMYLLNGIKSALSVLFYISTVAFLVSLGLVFIQLFILKAICLYCMVSALTSTVVFLLSLFYWRNLR